MVDDDLLTGNVGLPIGVTRSEFEELQVLSMVVKQDRSAWCPNCCGACRQLHHTNGGQYEQYEQI